MKKQLFFIGITISAITAAFGWGDQGHKAIWQAAQQNLTPAAKKAVNKILANDKLTMTAVWLDRVREAATRKQGPLASDQEALDFINGFPGNPNWHFVNLPLAATAYQPNTPFTSADDVVQRLNFCIRVLEGKETSLSKRIALRCVVHLVGDIHQPLHCATGYYDVSNEQQPQLKRDANAAETCCLKFEDRGGNELKYGTGRMDELHGMWDGDLVTIVAGNSSSYRDLAEILADNMQSVQVSDPADIHDWAAAWAVESVKLANQFSYQGFDFGACKLDSGKTKIEGISISFTNGIDGYEQDHADIVSQQLTKAAIRLANVLNKVLK